MLKLKVVIEEFYDETSEEFIQKTYELELEHSLLSMSKWESKYEKPFLSDDDKTDEEVLDYVSMMILTEDYPPDIINFLDSKNVEEINDYIKAKMTATWFSENQRGGLNQEKITSELIYYWMTSYQIPWEAETWHLNRLFTLIRVFNVKNSKKEKMKPREAAARRRAMNEQRLSKYNTTG